ncbi:MAG TPA: acyltransferase [Caulobacteraceae bacterium]|jgi:peptidoglycan/LPS O-acetylase OafA/YrhL
MKRFTIASAEADPLARGGALDLLRFLAAGFIVLYHYEAYAPLPFADIHPALTRGHLGTDFFLMLSGYVLGRAYGRQVGEGRIGPAAFLTRRVARVWPGHLIVLAALALLVLGAGLAGLTLNNPHAFDWGALPAHALLAQSWGLGVPYGWNTPTWSLSALIICYAAFPLLWPVLQRLGGRGALVAAVVLLAGCDLAARSVGIRFFDLAGEVGVLRALPLFILGMALARYGAPAGLSLGAARVVGLGALAGFLGLQLLGEFDLLSMLAIAVVVLMAGARTPPRTSDLVRRAAELSFALYVTHSLVGMIWYRALETVGVGLEGPLGWMVWSSGFPVAVLVAWLFHVVIDQPLQNWIKPRLGRGPTPTRVALGVV